MLELLFRRGFLIPGPGKPNDCGIEINPGLFTLFYGHFNQVFGALHKFNGTGCGFQLFLSQQYPEIGGPHPRLGGYLQVFKLLLPGREIALGTRLAKVAAVTHPDFLSNPHPIFKGLVGLIRGLTGPQLKLWIARRPAAGMIKLSLLYRDRGPPQSQYRAVLESHHHGLVQGNSLAGFGLLIFFQRHTLFCLGRHHRRDGQGSRNYHRAQQQSFVHSVSSWLFD